MITTNSNASTATYFIEKIIGHKFNIHEILIFFLWKPEKLMKPQYCKWMWALFHNIPCDIQEGPPSFMGDSNMASAKFSFIFSSNSSLPLGCLATVDSAQLLYTSHKFGDWSKLPGSKIKLNLDLLGRHNCSHKLFSFFSLLQHLMYSKNYPWSCTVLYFKSNNLSFYIIL